MRWPVIPVFIGDDGILCLIHMALEINDVPKGPFLLDMIQSEY